MGREGGVGRVPGGQQVLGRLAGGQHVLGREASCSRITERWTRTARREGVADLVKRIVQLFILEQICSSTDYGLTDAVEL